MYKVNDMNKRIVVKNNFGKVCFCVIDGNADTEAELNKVYDFAPGGGYRAELWGNVIKIVDYFRGDAVATVDVLSIEDTESNTQYCWSEVE